MHAAHLWRPCAQQRVRGSHDGRAGRAEAFTQRGVQRRRRRKHGREQAQPLDVRHRAHGRRPCRQGLGFKGIVAGKLTAKHGSGASAPLNMPSSSAPTRSRLTFLHSASRTCMHSSVFMPAEHAGFGRSKVPAAKLLLGNCNFTNLAIKQAL